MNILSNAIAIAGSGLEAQAMRVRIASENLANAESTGKTSAERPYTRKVVSFDTVLDEEAGGGHVRVSDVAFDAAPPRVVRNPGHPAADAAGNVKMPNVNPLVEMADIREAARSYEANIQVIRQARDMTSMTIELLRSS
jgi:flagellar basal-body rod protein FlgC